MISSIVNKFSSASSASESQSAASSQTSSPQPANKLRRKFLSSSTNTTPAPNFPPVSTNKKVTKSTSRPTRTSSHEPLGRVQKPQPPRLTTPTKTYSAVCKTPTKEPINCKLMSRLNFATLNSMFSEKLKVTSTDFKSSGSEFSSSSDLPTAGENQTAQSLYKPVVTTKPAVVTKPTSVLETKKVFGNLNKLAEKPVAIPRFADEPDYRMNHQRRGYAVIINNSKFVNMPAREGTDHDAACLVASLKRLDFETKLFHNCTAANIRNLVNYYAKLDHSDADCFAFAVLSHGENDVLHGVDGPVDVDELTRPFKANRTLAGKPKIFIFQACRGAQLMDSVDTNPFETHYVSHIPMEADFLVCYSTVAGFYSWRNSQTGSWFIQSLCGILDELGNELEVMQLLTIVNRRVAFYYKSNASDPSMSGKRQVPCIVSMLTKELYFKPKVGAQPSSVSYA